MDRADLDTCFFTLKRDHPNLKSKYIQKLVRFNLRGVLLLSQSFTEKHVLECAFAHPIMFSFFETCNSREVIYDNMIFHLGLHDLYTEIKIQNYGPNELQTDNKANVVRE